jgi:hypothetical protein
VKKCKTKRKQKEQRVDPFIQRHFSVLLGKLFACVSLKSASVRAYTSRGGSHETLESLGSRKILPLKSKIIKLCIPFSFLLLSGCNEINGNLSLVFFKLGKARRSSH